MHIGTPVGAARAHEEMFAYWASRRQGGKLPGRESIHPSHFKRHLPTVSLIDVVSELDERRYRLRLAGTGLYGVYGREITGRLIEDVYMGPAAAYWREELDKIVDSRKPGVGVHNLSWRGASHLSILWLRMPLASNGRDVDMIMGYDVVVGQQTEFSSGIRAA
jgi:hypothetical protein